MAASVRASHTMPACSRSWVCNGGNMPSRRADVEMSPDEIRDYLRSHFRLTLVSNGLGGYPHPMPMNYAVDDDDRIVMTTFRKSQKVANLRRDPRATLLVETGVAY